MLTDTNASKVNHTGQFKQRQIYNFYKTPNQPLSKTVRNDEDKTHGQ